MEFYDNADTSQPQNPSPDQPHPDESHSAVDNESEHLFEEQANGRWREILCSFGIAVKATSPDDAGWFNADVGGRPLRLNNVTGYVKDGESDTHGLALIADRFGISEQDVQVLVLCEIIRTGNRLPPRVGALSVKTYAEKHRLDPAWLRSTFHATDEGGRVVLPYLAAGETPAEAASWKRLAATTALSCLVGKSDRAVYGLNFVDEYHHDTLYVGVGEWNVHVGRLYELQVLALPEPGKGVAKLAAIIRERSNLRIVVVLAPGRGDPLTAQLLKALGPGWDGDLREMTSDLSDLHLQFGTSGFAEKLASLTERAPQVHIHPGSEYLQEFPLTDCGNARRFAVQHGRDLKYLVEGDCWMRWSGNRWAREGVLTAEARAKQTALGIVADAMRVEGDTRDVHKHAKASQSRLGVTNMILLARSEPGIAVRTEQLDADPWLLNVLNGTVDLRAGTFRQHRREDLITNVCPVAYNPDSRCPAWTEFLDMVTGGTVGADGTVGPGDPGLLRYLQTLAGCLLTGDTSVKALFLLYGPGDGGKSTFTDTIGGLLGDYFVSASAATIMHQRLGRSGGSASPDVARLRGARLILVSEVDESQKWSQGILKAMTGGDVITARFLNQNDFQFKLTGKIVAHGNTRPKVVQDGDDAFWNRLHAVPFEHPIPVDLVDPRRHKRRRREEVDAVLRAEFPGILNWALEGCRRYIGEGLTRPPVVEAAGRQYREESDLIKTFLVERCVTETDPVEQRVTNTMGTVLYADFKEWCEAANERYFPTRSDFYARLKKLDFRNGRTGGSIRFDGIMLRSALPPWSGGLNPLAS